MIRKGFIKESLIKEKLKNSFDTKLKPVSLVSIRTVTRIEKTLRPSVAHAWRYSIAGYSLRYRQRGNLLKNMNSKKESWTLEWSESQKCFHIDELDRTIIKNLKIFKEPNNCNDWSLIAILDSHEQCEVFLSKIKTVRGLK